MDEGTPGSAVAADTIWRGIGAGPEILDDIQFVEEDTGTFGGQNRTVRLSTGAQIALAATPLTFEQFPLLCQMGIEAQQTGVADTGSGASGKIYTFDFPLLAVNTMRTYTVEAGNNEECGDIEYCFCPEFSVTGAPNAAVMMSGLLRGRQNTPAQSFAEIAVADVDEAVFNLSTLQLDAIDGTMGDTNVPGVLMGYTINVKTGLLPMFTGDGQLYFYNTEQAGWVITADVVFKHVAGTDAEHAIWLAQTARLLEIKLEGAALGTAGAVYSKKTARFQLPGKWQTFTTLNDMDGIDIMTGTFRAAYDPTATLGPKIIVVNETANYWA